MSQIVKRKKKGRPSKADLARRAAEATERDVRRSLRRRNVRYTFDFDDFIDEEDGVGVGEDDDGEDEMRREKKLKLLLKLQGKEGGAESPPSRTRRVAHAPDASSSDDGDGGKPLKKRKIDDDDDEANEINDDDEEIRGRQTELKGPDSVPGTPSDPPQVFALPDKKSLELILDKLQKKDIYGVYAEPVDPEELPDYHDVIEHPMDFSTVRKKLGNGLYSTLEQLESDVFLICTNAMQYNAPDTIYYKQAHTIEELAKKKFQRLRNNAERSEKEIKSEQITSNSLAKKQIKKPMSLTAQEPVGSDFSSGATLATAGDFQSGLNATQAGGGERLSNVDGSAEGNTTLIDNNLEKVEDLLSGRGILSRSGKKSSIHDENRRATYNISNQPVSRSESIFTTFGGEIKQLVAVGLHADHSYARSLARFAATLGPAAWKVASERIVQALPPGFKFGRGWVGDYEPLPTPILMLDKSSQKEPAPVTNLLCTSDARKDEKSLKTPVSSQEHTVSVPTSRGKSSLCATAVTSTTITPAASASVSPREQSISVANLERKQPFFGSRGSRATTTATANVNYQQQSPRTRNIEPEKKVTKQVELNCPPPSANQTTCDFVAERQTPNSNVPASRSMETVSRNRNLLQPVPLNQPENNGFAAGGLMNGKVSSNALERNRTVTSSSGGIPNQMAATATYFSQGQEQGLSDPVQLMRMLAENAQKQQKSLNHSPVDNTSVAASVPSSRSDDSSNAAAAAARAWMSIGSGVPKPAAENTSTHKNQISADSLYNPTKQLQQQGSQFPANIPVFGMHFQPGKNNFPIQAFMAPHVRMPSEAQFQNRPMFFPPLVTADLSRFQMPSPRQGLNNSPRQPRHKQESVPPDLNIGFQSSGSPVRQMVDSQQPDLALQL
ncbi:Bromodomain and PHD finger-containing protein [Actinidia chinensis var. chinensis]|uniref:Bromodomain and PHD finger-containing protein n=1 Tax=Actinidia chinensis var. chinensis TaxID=1590841 RepID=A0A2R6QDE8_ACTCC|nr:Bromodomain and PHD finger-containing protein [Actinidia chinensis var. chinensis]